MKNYRSIVIEGGDQVGKADASQNMIKILRKNIPITMISFPMYSMPIGASIRKMLKEGIEDLVKEKNINPKDEFESRMAIYALNRLEVMNSLLDEKYKNRLLIFDRSPYSNALTIAYGIKGSDKIKESKVERYNDIGLNSEKFFIDNLNLRNCILELYDSSDKWIGNRSNGDDQYEMSSVQEFCGQLYSIYSKKVGKGWCKIPTKVDNQWREREDISKDILNFVYSRYPEIEKMKCDEPDVEILELTEAVRALYVNTSVSKEHMLALRESLEKNDKTTLYENSITVVEDTIQSMDFIIWSNEGIKNAFKEILEKNIFCLDIIEKFLGDKYVKLLKKSLE